MTDLTSLRHSVSELLGSMNDSSDDLKQFLAEFKRFEEITIEKDALITEKDGLISGQSSLLALNETTILDLRNRISGYETQISQLQAEIESLKASLPSVPPKPPDPKPPIIVNSPPNFSITISPSPSSSPVAFTATGPGIPNPYSPSERRWFWDLDSEIQIILDARPGSDGQRRLTFQRAWSDLPLTAPVRELRAIRVNSDDEKSSLEALRIHHHQRLPFTYNRSAELTRPEFLPNYDLANKSPNKIDWRWDLAPAKDADLFSENYYLAHQSWVGGVPLANEASMLPPWDLELLFSTLPPANREQIFSTWDSIGNYPIHFYDRETGKPCLPSSPSVSSIPVLNLDNFPLPDPSTHLKTRSGAVLPVPDMAHNFGLPNLGAMSTHDLFYIEALESFVLLGSLARKPSDSFIPRSSGLYFSGQVRSTAWWMRDLSHLYLATGDIRFKHQMIRQLNLLEHTFAIPGQNEYRPSGLLSFAPRKPSPWNQFSSPGEHETPTGNHHFLAFVLNEISQHLEFASSARPILLHVLKVTEGVWLNSSSKFFAPWLRHAVPSPSASWPEIVATTFKSFTPQANKLGAPSPGFSAAPLTTDIACWYRAAVIAAVERKLPWAPEALAWLNAQIPASRRPVAWNVKPRTGGAK